jgi:hypothetical protein
MDAPTDKWWTGWKKRNEKQFAVKIELWREGALRQQLISPDAADIRRHYYDPCRATGADVQPLAERPPVVPVDPQKATALETALFVRQLREAGHQLLYAAAPVPPRRFGAGTAWRVRFQVSVSPAVTASRSLRPPVGSGSRRWGSARPAPPGTAGVCRRGCGPARRSRGPGPGWWPGLGSVGIAARAGPGRPRWACPAGRVIQPVMSRVGGTGGRGGVGLVAAADGDQVPAQGAFAAGVAALADLVSAHANSPRTWPRTGPDKVTVLRADPEPGLEGQIDYGLLGSWTDPRTGCSPRIWAFVMVLSRSRLVFVRPVISMDQASWTASHVEAFAFFGGCPARLIRTRIQLVSSGPLGEGSSPGR